MNNPTQEQARKLLKRWGYEPVTDPNLSWDAKIAHERTATVWRKGENCVFISSPLQPLIAQLATLHKMELSVVHKIMLAEPGQIRNLGTIEVIPQEIDPDYQGKVPHSPAALKMDKQGRDRLIAALIEGRNEIAVYDEAGEGYSLLLEAIDGN